MHNVDHCRISALTHSLTSFNEVGDSLQMRPAVQRQYGADRRREWRFQWVLEGDSALLGERLLPFVSVR
eukprot:TRINITY_DN6403_c0_g1_i1.p1 TRINITY_DN6403_c0_g1~~TRINITY_DN6403_c0_g1_i1.p1  ORF type:complete len:69 (+),score=0.31 TRINITY_DN6403_c0_g1_i1:387-593(+)